MASSGSQDKSLTGGISIPNWMKQKIGDRYDLDDTTFSPPSQDDSFFYIRYPKTTARPPSETNYHRINQYLENQAAVAAPSTAPIATPSTSSMASDTSLTRTLTSQTAASQFKTTPAISLDFDPDQPPPNLSHRRGSKSLPSSPLSSPNSSPRLQRKNPSSTLQHRYFTAAFPQPKGDSSQGYSGWLEQQAVSTTEPLAPISESPGKLSVPDKEQQSLRKSASAAVLRGKDEDEEEKPVTAAVFQDKPKVIRPKPSELREMNFWSPTSM
ncbi:hypothetical protein B566_EDAN005101 [Ephemera danica]|nr:hypothetical protein B566_EDAN005101 [Ephemera danica]